MLITNKRMIKSILEVLADDELRAIFKSIQYRSASANEILLATKVPHTSFYRKINWLLTEDLAIVESIQETRDKKKYSMFRAVFDSFEIKINDDVKIEANTTLDMAEKTAKEFFTI